MGQQPQSGWTVSHQLTFSSHQPTGNLNREDEEKANFNSIRRVNLPPPPSRSSWYRCNPPQHLSLSPSPQRANLNGEVVRMPNFNPEPPMGYSFLWENQEPPKLSPLLLTPSVQDTPIVQLSGSTIVTQETSLNYSQVQSTPLNLSIRSAQHPDGAANQIHPLPSANAPLFSPVKGYPKYLN
ncbi:unnamed protein product [Hymenolepis diminuta]|nr:unnamed protein product [Hymenolepis diminuta]